MRLLDEAAGNGARLIVFPEAASQSFDSGRLDTQAADLEGEFATRLRERATELGVTVVAGTFRPADTVQRGGKTINRVYNTALVTGPGVHCGYDKIHTYDAFDYRESDTVLAGTELLTVPLADAAAPSDADSDADSPDAAQAEAVTIGVATCYDVRFPEQFKALARAGAQVIALPFSWADGPGKRDQWRLLSAARALDSTCFIVAAGQARPGGAAEAGKPSGPTGLGHSVIVSPEGVRLAEAGYEEEIIYADLDIADLPRVRAALPVLEG